MEEPPATTIQTTAAVTTTYEVDQNTTDHPTKTEGGDPVTTDRQTTTSVITTVVVEQTTTGHPTTTKGGDLVTTDRQTTTAVTTTMDYSTTSTDEVEQITSDLPATTDEVDQTFTDHPTTTDGVDPVKTDRQTTAVTMTDEVEQTTTDPAVNRTDKFEQTTTDLPATTDEVEQTSTDHPTTSEGVDPVKTDRQTTEAVTTADAVVAVENPTTKDDPTTKYKVEQTTVDYPTTSEKDEQTTTNNQTSNTIADVSTMIEDLVATTSERRDPESTFTTMETSTVSQNPPVQSNVPGITIESIAELKVNIPEGCFEGISDLCQLNAVNVTSCSNSNVSDLLVDQIVNSISIDLGIQHFIVKDVDFSTSVTHNSICEENQETDWVETYEIISSESREPNSTYDVAVVLLRQEFTAISFLQVSINSFGTSSVQRACSFVNGNTVEFSSVPGGIVGGYSVSKDIYDCSQYVTGPFDSLLDEDVASYSTSSTILVLHDKYIYPDLSDDVGLALEYLIVCIYILVSVYGAYRSYKVHQLQRTRSEYKTNVNIGFIALFSIWASGNLLFMVLYSFFLTESNFFYIKSVLTLTYFATYFGFTLLILYRYESLL
jgi:hypothetical protein